MLKAIMAALGYVPASEAKCPVDHDRLIATASEMAIANILGGVIDWLGERIDENRAKHRETGSMIEYRNDLMSRQLQAKRASR